MTADSATRRLVEQYYDLIDSGDLHQACGLMAENVKFTFANADPIFGQESAEAAIQVVLDRCTAIRHRVVTWFEEPGPDGSVNANFEIRIRYDLKNGKVLDNPGAVFATVNDDGVFTEQRLYGDLNEVFAD
ncbi:nuclear transport factor 2 family protein [Actinoallomurus spadix]|uniref:SnoaL-like domain-containing protein n=1 Tax=Actinoallomurus spadix TaxID=79912 RepID=A0ABP3HC75_9ACTN|nr:nuclear transport factor 2 family protein [Actinoallomurus spadix]MCO5987604.1 nuclear transport factor 2 family protein [Actinoallomurus spadix]